MTQRQDGFVYSHDWIDEVLSPLGGLPLRPLQVSVSQWEPTPRPGKLEQLNPSNGSIVVATPDFVGMAGWNGGVSAHALESWFSSMLRLQGPDSKSAISRLTHACIDELNGGIYSNCDVEYTILFRTPRHLWVWRAGSHCVLSGTPTSLHLLGLDIRLPALTRAGARFPFAGDSSGPLDEVTPSTLPGLSRLAYQLLPVTDAGDRLIALCDRGTSPFGPIDEIALARLHNHQAGWHHGLRGRMALAASTGADASVAAFLAHQP